MLKVIPNLSCDFYGGSRAGWGCAKWSDIFTDPLPTACAFILSLLVLFLQCLVRGKALPLPNVLNILAAQSLFACGFGTVIRVFYYFSEVASNAYLIQALPIIGIALASIFILIFVHSKQTSSERERRTRQDIYIDTEITERMEKQKVKQ